jgi:hypothetical protein
VQGNSQQPIKKSHPVGMVISMVLFIASVAAIAVLLARLPKIIADFPYFFTNTVTGSTYQATDPAPYIMMFFIALVVMFVSLAMLITLNKSRKLDKLQDKLNSMGEGLSSDEFMRNWRTIGRNDDITGVYVLHNESNDKSYVGQSVRVYHRVHAHLTGRGNGDVYADYKHGDKFDIRAITLAESGYPSLNALEKDAISAHRARTKGYNKQRGNRS